MTTRAARKTSGALYHEETGETLVRYDIHHGKGHHRHVLGREESYEWRSVDALLEDFRRDIEMIKQMIREGKI